MYLIFLANFETNKQKEMSFAANILALNNPQSTPSTPPVPAPPGPSSKSYEDIFTIIHKVRKFSKKKHKTFIPYLAGFDPGP